MIKWLTRTKIILENSFEILGVMKITMKLYRKVSKLIIYQSCYREYRSFSRYDFNKNFLVSNGVKWSIAV